MAILLHSRVGETLIPYPDALAPVQLPTEQVSFDNPDERSPDEQ
jgi:hypothetical protein